MANATTLVVLVVVLKPTEEAATSICSASVPNSVIMRVTTPSLSVSPSHLVHTTLAGNFVILTSAPDMGMSRPSRLSMTDTLMRAFDKASPSFTGLIGSSSFPASSLDVLTTSDHFSATPCGIPKDSRSPETTVLLSMRPSKAAR